MRIESHLLLVGLFILFSAQAGGEQTKSLLFGVNYLPQVTCVEDFSPYWITDNWTEKRMVTDLKIMKAIGCSCVRYHIYPAPPARRPGRASLRRSSCPCWTWA